MRAGLDAVRHQDRDAARADLRRPGRANSESAGDVVDLGLRRLLERLAAAASGTSIPSPPPRLRRVARHVGEHRHHALAHRAGLHARQLEAEAPARCASFSTGVWLFQNSVACV